MRSNNYSPPDKSQAFSNSVCAVACNLLLRAPSHAADHDSQFVFKKEPRQGSVGDDNCKCEPAIYDQRRGRPNQGERSRMDQVTGD